MIVKAIKCTQCADVIWSRHRHDWRQCSCKAYFIDGGRDYTRIGGDFDKLGKPAVFDLEVEP